MKLKHFLSLAVMTAFGASSAWGQISTMPYSTDFSSENPFDGGSVVDGTNVKSVLNVNNTSTAAEFLIDGENPYVLSENEEVTVTFTAYHGWLSNGKDQSVALLNSDGVVLASYTYTLGSCVLSGITVGGQAQSFTSYNCQSDHPTNNKNANGLTGNGYPYNADDEYNPTFTFKVKKSGSCTVGVSLPRKNIDNIYTATAAEDVKIDLAKIVISSGSNNGDRTICIDNLSITSETSSTPSADYIIKFVDSYGTEVKDHLTFNANVNEAPTIPASSKDPFFVGEKKYFYVSDDAESQTIAANGSTVVTITVREADVYNYSLTNNINSSSISGSSLEGNTVELPYSRYMLDGTTLYEAAATDKQYRKYATLTEDNVEVNVEYAPVANDVVFYTEGEDIDGTTLTTYGNIPVRGSAAKAATLAEGELYFTEILEPGTYKMVAGIFTSQSKEFDQIAPIKIGVYGQEIYDLSFGFYGVNLNQVESEEFTLTSGAKVLFIGDENYGNKAALDYVYIVKVPSADESAADINGDGEVNVADAVALITEIVGGAADAKYDLNGDGSVDAEDAEEVINIYLKNK